VTLNSRRKHVLNSNFGYAVAALEQLPDETVVDGELMEELLDQHAAYRTQRSVSSALPLLTRRMLPSSAAFSLRSCGGPYVVE
jgi:hypothetical protein